MEFKTSYLQKVMIYDCKWMIAISFRINTRNWWSKSVNGEINLLLTVRNHIFCVPTEYCYIVLLNCFKTNFAHTDSDADAFFQPQKPQIRGN